MGQVNISAALAVETRRGCASCRGSPGVTGEASVTADTWPPPE